MSTQRFLLVDGVLLPDALKVLYGQGENLEIHPLYLTTRWARLNDLGPILVQASPRLGEQWHCDPQWLACSCLLSSAAPLQEVATHLRRFVAPPDYLGNTSLLRFADPLVAYHWLASHEQAHLNRILGPIEQLSVVMPRQPWHPPPAQPVATFSVEGPAHAWEPGSERLGPGQLQALEHAYEWRFKKRLHDWLTRETPTAFAGQNSEQIDTWLQQALQSGRHWGLTEEFTLATWAWYRLTLGADFIIAPDGAYQAWLARHPEQRQRTADQRLDDFDLYREQTLTGARAHD